MFRINLCIFLCIHIVSALSGEICKSFINSNCVKINECEPFANHMTFFETTSETREILRKISCGFDAATPKVCCPTSHPIPIDLTPQLYKLDPTGITVDPIFLKEQELAVSFGPDKIHDKRLRYGGMALDTILDKVAEPTTLKSYLKFWKPNNEPSGTTINTDNLQGEMNQANNPSSQDKVEQTELGYRDLVLETMRDKVVESTVLLEPNKFWKLNNEPTPTTLYSDSMQGKIKHDTTPLSSKKVMHLESSHGDINLDTKRDEVIEPSILLSPIKFGNPIDESTATTLNSMQEDMKHTFTPLSQGKNRQIEPGYRVIALNRIWDKVVEPTTQISPIEFVNPTNKFTATTLKTNSMQKDTNNTTTPLSQGKVRQIEPGYRGIALNRIWDKVVEPTTQISPIKFVNPINKFTATILKTNSTQKDTNNTITPLNQGKVRQIEPGYKGIALNRIWDKVVEPTTQISPIKFVNPINKFTATTLKTSSTQKDTNNTTIPLSQGKVRQVEPGYRGIALNRIWDQVVEPTTLLSSIKFLKPVNEVKATTLNSNSIQKDLEYISTPSSPSKVEQIVPGYRDIALYSIWNKVVESSTLLSAINFLKPTTVPTTTSLNKKSIEMGNADDNLNLNIIWQIDPSAPTLAPVRILEYTQKPLPVISITDLDLEKPAKISSDFIAAFPSPPECGVSKSSFGGRVVDGVDAYLGDLPWMALLGYRDSVSVTSWNCGGSLISHHHVLTAAHCIHNNEIALYVVRLGELDLAREDEGAIPIDVLIKHKVKHELYNPKSYENDIGLLVLQKDVQFTDLIKPICMPLVSELRSADLESWMPFIAGWGKTKARGSSATRLQVLQLPVISNEVCTKAYKPYDNQVIDHRVVCAGFIKGGKDSCSGDSGGPLMQPFPQNFTSFFYQIGVISYGVKDCARPGYPGVYTRITSFMTWLETNILGAS